MVINYAPSFNLPVYSVKLIFDDNKEFQMIKYDDTWIVELDFTEGSYNYRFLINNQISINDPLADTYVIDSSDIVWSSFSIDESGNRYTSDSQYTVNIENYDFISEVSEIATCKNSFNTHSDKLTALKFEFTDVIGLHTATLLWIDPNGILFDITENNLSNQNPDEKTTIYFCLNYEHQTTRFKPGIWSVVLLIDGQYILEDKFDLENDYFCTTSVYFEAKI